MSPTEKSGYVIVACGVFLTTVSCLIVGGTRGYVLAAINITCIVVAIISIRTLHDIRRRR